MKPRELIERYKQLHVGGEYFYKGQLSSTDKFVLWDGGCFARKLMGLTRRVVEKHKHPVKVLDYGCGKAKYARKLTEHFPTNIDTWRLYDPAVENYSTKPRGKFDVVVCADVMEHVPDYGRVLDDIAKYLKDDGIALFTISGNPDARQFLDGMNMHCTLKSGDEWRALIKKHFGDKKVILIYNNTEYWESWNATVRVRMQGV